MAVNPAGDTVFQWLVQYRDIGELWKSQPSFFLTQTVYILGGIITGLHAFNKGGRWPFYWFGAILHGLIADNIWAWIIPDYDNFWHSPTPIMFLGNRFPIYIIFLYPVFIYHAAYAVSRLNLPKYTQPFAVGILIVLIDLPFDIVGIKFVHWTWHDTDPNLIERHYSVPWNSYYFHATFGASYYFFFHQIRSWSAPRVAQWDRAGKFAEWKSMVIAAMLGTPGGVLLFIPIYHPLHDFYKIHTEVAFFALFAVYGVIILHGLLGDRDRTVKKLTTIDYLLIGQLALHLIIYLLLVIFFNPEDEWSTGFHEQIGPCDEYDSLISAIGQPLPKRKYLCATDYDEEYYDFHCVDKLPAHGTKWYTICGTPFKNRAEYIAVISSILIAAYGIFYSIYFRAGTVEVASTNKKVKKN